ncbi:hypothetical protein JOB18_033678 [Solea senegalensis]|uniref:Uncharacterized protein n=1 Tax=Solea senegalensis TaxID=28829 RepID=A0AAV6RPZ2_SOLSE|nr:hypothetical protein JOB18_033678 [Solea senegalensis]
MSSTGGTQEQTQQTHIRLRLIISDATVKESGGEGEEREVRQSGGEQKQAYSQNKCTSLFSICAVLKRLWDDNYPSSKNPFHTVVSSARIEGNKETSYSRTESSLSTHGFSMSYSCDLLNTTEDVPWRYRHSVDTATATEINEPSGKIQWRHNS